MLQSCLRLKFSRFQQVKKERRVNAFKKYRLSIVVTGIIYECKVIIYLRGVQESHLFFLTANGANDGKFHCGMKLLSGSLLFVGGEVVNFAVCKRNGK